MDHQFYRQTVARMQEMRVDPDYIQGWIGGYMGNPRREEQRVTEAYGSGYEDGEKHDGASFERWIAG